MIYVYVCPKDVYEDILGDRLETLVWLYPETEVCSEDWLQFYEDKLLNPTHGFKDIAVVTQSCELIKFLSVNSLDYEIEVFKKGCDTSENMSADDARAFLLETYETLMIKGCLFGEGGEA